MFEYYRSRENITSGIKQTISGAPTIIDLHKAINNLANKIDDSSGQVDSVISILVNSTEFIDDRMVEGVQAVNALHAMTDIDNDDYQHLLEQFLKLIPDTEQVNFSDVDGNVYSFYRNGSEIYVKSSTDYKLLSYDEGRPQIDLLIDSVDNTGHIWLSDLASQVAESQTINFVLSTASRMLNSATFTVADFTSQVTNYCGNFGGAVADVVNQITQAFTTCGFAGAAGIIVEYMKSAANITYNSSAKLTFSFATNETLIPQEYIVGMIPGLISTVSAAAGLIAAAFNPLIGAAIAGAGYLASTIVNHFISDYDKTVCQYISQDDENAKFGQIDAFPHGFFRSYKGWSNVTGELEEIIARSPLMVDVPGGYMFVSAYKSDGNNISHATVHLQYEFHPSIHWHVIGSNPNHSDWVTQSMTIDHVYDNYRRSYCKVNLLALRNSWLNHLENVAPQVVKITPIDSMDINRDKLLRITLMHNLGVFLWWTFVCGSSYGIYDVDYRMPGFIIDRVNDIVYPDNNASYTIGDYCMSIGFMDYQWIMNNYSKMVDNQLWTWTQLANLAGTTNPGSGAMSAITQLHHIESVPSDTAFSAAWNNPNTFSFGPRDDVFYSDIAANILTNSYDGYLNFPTKLSYSIQTPKYNRSTFFLWIAVVAAASAVAIATIVGLTIYGKRAFRRMKARRIANVENSWNRYVKSGSKEDLLAYELAVKKNNKLANIVGGTKFSKQGYWISDSSSSSDVNNTSNINRLYNLLSGSRDNTSNTIDDVLTLIHG